jgi:hypothetical protein
MCVLNQYRMSEDHYFRNPELESCAASPVRLVMLFNEANTERPNASGGNETRESEEP